MVKHRRYDVTEEERQAFQSWTSSGMTNNKVISAYREKFPDSGRTDAAVAALAVRTRRQTRVSQPNSLSTELLSLVEKVEKLENENKRLLEDNEKLAKFVKSLKKVREAVEDWQEGFLKGEY